MNKMDCETSGHKQPRYDEVANKVKSMVATDGWKADLVKKNTLVLPVSVGMDDDL